MKPGNRSHRPIAILVLFRERLGDLSENGVVVRHLIEAHAAVIDSLGRKFRIGVFLYYRRVSPLGIGPLFIHKSDARQSHIEVDPEFLRW